MTVCLYASAAEQKTVILPEHHPWGAFRPGAWKQVCVVTETLDEKGFVKNTSTIETKTTLISVDEDVLLSLRRHTPNLGLRVRSPATAKSRL